MTQQESLHTKFRIIEFVNQETSQFLYSHIHIQNLSRIYKMRNTTLVLSLLLLVPFTQVVFAQIENPSPPRIPEPSPEPEPIAIPEPEPIKEPFPEETESEKIERLTEENEKLREENSNLEDQVTKLIQEIVNLDEKIKELQTIILEQIKIIMNLINGIESNT